MGKATVRVDKELLEQIQKWLEENGNKYQFSSITSFVNSAIYDKLKKLKKEGK